MPKFQLSAPPQTCASRRAWLMLLALRCATVAGTCLAGTGNAAPPALQQARQWVLVVAADRDGSRGQLQAFERTTQGWPTHGQRFDVALGRHGRAWTLPAAEPAP